MEIPAGSYPCIFCLSPEPVLRLRKKGKGKSLLRCKRCGTVMFIGNSDHAVFGQLLGRDQGGSTK